MRPDVDNRIGRDRIGRVMIALGYALFLAALVYAFLHGWRRDWRVPFSFTGDGLFYLMQSKSTIDNGWWWSNPMLGAPTVLDQLAFASNSNLDQAIVWVVSRFVGNAILAVNLAWIGMVVLSGLSAAWCLRRLNRSTVSALVGGTLFAVTPYALYRNIDHFAMVIYLVPFVTTMALLLASGAIPERGGSGSLAVLLAGSAVLGFNYVYYAFFGAFFIVVASVVGFWTYRKPRILAVGALCSVLIVGCTVVNLAPSVASWRREGKPTIIRDKVPGQAEIYGLKVRQLVSPVIPHGFPPFRRWTDKEASAQFPIETENTGSRLGVVGAVGFLTLLTLLLVPGAADRLTARNALLAASRLTIAAVLLATVGGFGSLFNLLVSPEIRAYTRITPFIAFFCLTAVAILLDALTRPRARLILAALVLTIGLTDQHYAAGGLNSEYARAAGEMLPLEEFVGQLEAHLPGRAMIFQLPVRTYLNDSGVARMLPYDHLKLYAVSHRLHWSYPALSNEQVTWQQAAANVPLARLPDQLAAEGFQAIVVDRFGYADNGAATLAVLRARLGEARVLAQTDRYVALDVRALGEAGTPLTPLPRKLVPATTTLASCGEAPTMNIDQVGEVNAPLTQPELTVSAAGGLRIVGWAIDARHQSRAAGVDVLIDGSPYPSFYGADRSDVAQYFKWPAYSESGFTGIIPADVLKPGRHELSLRVVSAAKDCYYPTAIRSIVVN